MDFTINSKQKKVELFYESAREQAAIIEFLSKWLTFKEEKTKNQPVYRSDEIAWASNSTSRGVCENLTDHIYTNSTDITSAIIDGKDISNTITIERADLKTLEDLPSGCIHVSAKSKY